jgi:hypothetical protein
MERMPEPGDLIEAFSPQPGRCFRMVQSRQLQATHCRQEPAWKGVWKGAAGTWRRAESTRPRCASPSRKASEADEPAHSGGLPEMP